MRRFVAVVVSVLLGAVPATLASAGPLLVVSDPVEFGDRGAEVAVVQAALTEGGWPTWIDGVFGPHTLKMVTGFQRANGLVVDGIVGPQTLRALGIATAPPPVTGDGCDVAERALRAAGASDWETSFGVRIAWRESRCRLNAVNQNPSTRDNSWGPWQINYYGNLYNSRVALVGHPESLVSDWVTAARAFLVLGRTSGWCHWQPPDYC